MSRSGYVDDGEGGWREICWRGAVKKAIEGKRGQAFLRELVDALDAMPGKGLIAGELVDDDGDCCAIGAVCKSRGIDPSGVDYDCTYAVSRLAGIARSMVAEISYENDEEMGSSETPESRWQRMRAWAVSNLV